MTMADSSSSDNTPEEQQNYNSDDPDHEEHRKPLHLDLGDDLAHSSDTNRLEDQSAGPSDSGMNGGANRREENPFSFKHFLQSDSNSYQCKGARPKVYCEGRPVTSISDLDFSSMSEAKQTRIIPEYSSALPDFVQDHLVVEQCYLGSNSNSSNLDLDMNLPDFTPSRDSVHINRVMVDPPSQSNNNRSIPLDLPIRSPQVSFPLDLPHDPRNSTSSEVGISKSLPDFLADGAVRTQQNDGAMVEDNPEREYERMRRELDLTREQLVERNQQVEALSRELQLSKNREQEYMRNLAQALEQVENNSERNNVKRTCAENTIAKLKQEIKSLMMQMTSLKLENRTLRGEEGATGGHHNYYKSNNDFHSHKLAQELKAAASTAEHSLRQLLTGVDNLRIMAASLESIHRIEEPKEPFLNLDEDTGPAL